MPARPRRPTVPWAASAPCAPSARSSSSAPPAPPAPPARSAPSARAARAARSDGLETRGQILETAGRLFAEQGLERTTSRAICAAAGTNMAAVNYHFGGKDGLYEAVLVQAHGQLVQLDELEAIRQSGAAPEAQVAALIRLFVQRAPDSRLPWALRVLLREFMAPSTHVPALLQQAVLPKVALIRDMVAGVLGVPPSHASAQRALAFVVMPCVMRLLAPRDVLRQVLPALAADDKALADEMTVYALAGLASMARRPARGAPARRAVHSRT